MSPEITLSEALNSYFVWIQGRRHPSTVKLYEFYLRRFEIQHQTKVLGQVKRLDIESFSAKKHPLQILKAFFKWCVEVADYLPKSPCEKVRIPKSGHRDRVLSRAETIRFLRMTKCPLRQAMIFLKETGCRPGEMRAVEWGHLKNRHGTFPTLEELRQGEYFFSLNDFKGRAMRKNVAGTRVLVPGKRVGRLLSRQLEKGEVPQGKIFRSSKGREWSKNALRCSFRRLRMSCARKEPLKPLTIIPYHFRHTKATELAARGVNSVLLASFLGHSSTELLTWYVHPRIDDLLDLGQKD